MLNIRKATLADLPRVLAIYAYARRFMKQVGNPNQWGDNKPSVNQVEDDICSGYAYVCETPLSEIVGVFSFIPGPDVTYNTIYNGDWLNSDSYWVVHRLASNGKARGVGEEVLNWCVDQVGNVRIDTHNDNHMMRHIITKSGFVYCGIIYIDDGSPRIAFQKSLYLLA